MRNIKSILLITTIMLIILFVTIGLSYAYFTATVEGTEESTTITVTGGVINIHYDGGADINLNNILPSDNPAAIKTFTVTGNNTLDIEMIYKIELIISENSFSEEAIKYKLISTNTDNNGKTASSITELTNAGTGAKIINLGIGYFEVPTSGNKVHSYNLELYFPNQDYNQNIDQGKEIKAYISIENYEIKTITDAILSQDGGIATIESKPVPNFNILNEPSGIFVSTDSYGKSYYYRGLKSELNNNLIWGDFQWKIIRINGDSSVRLIYNGTKDQFNQNKIVNNTGLDTQIGAHPWNLTHYTDAKYVGYMYGGSNGVASTVRNGTTSNSATYNKTSTNVKNQLDSWYLNNIQNKGLSNQVVDNIFCNDRQLSSEIGGESTGPGYGNTGVHTYYAAYQRLYLSKKPNFRCGLKNDRFTVNDTVRGNAALTYPVGLMSADEAAMAGLRYITDTTDNYLYTNQDFWLMSPSGMYSGGWAGVMLVNSSGSLTRYVVNDIYGLRPVISINSEIRVIGTGSAVDPFIVY